MQNKNNITSLEHIANKLNIKIRCAEEGASGELFTQFINEFTEFSTEYKLHNDELLNNQIAVMANAYERNDKLFVADILQYELIPYLKNLEEVNSNKNNKIQKLNN
jgi:hypothetical protein